MSVKALNVILRTGYNLSDEQVAEFLYKKSDEGAITEELEDDDILSAKLIELDKDRISKIAKPVDTTELYNKAVKETEGKIHGKWENNLRTAFPTVDPEKKLKGDELVRAINLHISQQPPPTDLDVKKHADYLALERAREEGEASLRAEFERQLQEKEFEFQRRAQWDTDAKLIRANFLKLNPIMPADKAKQERIIEDFVSKFQSYRFQHNEDGSVLVLNEKGERINNDHGHALYMPDIVKKVAEMYHDFEKMPPIGNGGNDNNGGKPALTYVFKDENDFLEQFVKETDPEKKKAMGVVWRKQSGG